MLDLQFVDSKHGNETILDALQYSDYSVKSQSKGARLLSNVNRGMFRRYGMEEFVLASHIVRDHSYLHEEYATEHTLSMFSDKINKMSIAKRKMILDCYLQDFFYFDELTRVKGDSWVKNLFKVSNSNSKKDHCAVHVRLGDFYSELRDSFGVLSERYYLSAMTNMLENNPRVIFDIYSNDIPRAKELYGNFKNMEVNWIEPTAGRERYFSIESFLKFSTYDSKILGNSTFSFASARIGSLKSLVLYPRQMYKNAESKGIRNIPTGWFPIESNFIN
ncbi:MAG: hypothetical protein EB100_04055 [Crocinitomicaceae bacterium]|nr:hypothetical protein [Crocinitomicaceae bacterium]